MEIDINLEIAFWRLFVGRSVSWPAALAIAWYLSLTRKSPQPFFVSNDSSYSGHCDSSSRTLQSLMFDSMLEGDNIPGTELLRQTKLTPA